MECADTVAEVRLSIHLADIRGLIEMGFDHLLRANSG
jgi:hypothetical protein